MSMRQLAFFLFLLVIAGAASAADTNFYNPARENYHCIVCGKGPLDGSIWIHPRGVICAECEKIRERCSLCNLPVKDGDGHLKTGDGRFICKFDKNDVVLTLDQAKELFEKTRDDVVDLYGQNFALKYPDATVNLFDVDYWSEKGRTNNLHAFGFSSTRKTADGKCTHAIIMLSGRTHDEMVGVAAHEYTHLWINENCPDSRVIDGDTVEAICELTSYKLMQQKKLPEMQKRILSNPYTNGKIKTLIAVEHEGGSDYVLNWVKNGKGETLDESADLAPVPPPEAEASSLFYAVPQALPHGLKFAGVMIIGTLHQAVINGVGMAAGDKKTFALAGRTVTIRCREIHESEVAVEVNGDGNLLTLTKGEEKLLP